MWKKATVVEDEESRYHQMDIVWHYIASMKMPDSALRFPCLSRIALLVLTIPHSNAEEGRLFLVVRKNKTTFHSSLNPWGTLSSIMTIKLAQTEPAHKLSLPRSCWLRRQRQLTGSTIKNILTVVTSKMSIVVIPSLCILCNSACVLYQHNFSPLQTYKHKTQIINN